MGNLQSTEKSEQNSGNEATKAERKPKATRDAYGETLLELGRKRSDIVALDADLSGSTKTVKFGKEFPERFFNIGIAEQDMIGTAAGLALTGKVPFASTFAVFETGRAWDQIRLVVCYSNTNVKLVATHGGITVGEDGASHQALEDITLMRALPNMTVIVPADAAETASVIKYIADHKGPVYVRNIIAAGIMVDHACRAAEILSQEGIDAGVINMSTIKPLDEETLLSAAGSTKVIVTAEEHSVIGGLGGAVCEFLSEHHPMPVKRVGVQDTFGCSGSPDELLKLHGITADTIVETIKKSLNT